MSLPHDTRDDTGVDAASSDVNYHRLSFPRPLLQHPSVDHIAPWNLNLRYSPMDAVTVAGLAASAFHIAGLVGSTIQALHSLKGRFQDADTTIRQLINQLSTIKAAVSQIHDWAEFNSDDSPKGPEFMHGLNIALEGCQALMHRLSEEVKGLTSLQRPLDLLSGRHGLMDEGKADWNDATMKHQSMLFGQVQALLQLLLTAGQW